MRYTRSIKRPSMWDMLNALPAVGTLIIVTVVLSVLGFILALTVPDVFASLALKPERVFSAFGLLTLVTHLFLHGSFFHLLVNMLSLFFVGGVAERIIGKKRFVFFYLLAGVFAGLIFVAGAYTGTHFSWGERVFGGIGDSAVGASGAIFGLLGILAVLLPNKKVYLIAGPIIFLVLDVVVSPILPGAWGNVFSIFMNILVMISLLSFFFPRSRFSIVAVPLVLSLWIAPFIAIIPLFILSFYVSLPIANSAHFGGMIAGLIYGYYLRLRYRRKIALLERYFK